MFYILTTQNASSWKTFETFHFKKLILVSQIDSIIFLRKFQLPNSWNVLCTFIFKGKFLCCSDDKTHLEIPPTLLIILYLCFWNVIFFLKRYCVDTRYKLYRLGLLQCKNLKYIPKALSNVNFSLCFHNVSAMLVGTR